MNHWQLAYGKNCVLPSVTWPGKYSKSERSLGAIGWTESIFNNRIRTTRSNPHIPSSKEKTLIANFISPTFLSNRLPIPDELAALNEAGSSWRLSTCCLFNSRISSQRWVYCCVRAGYCPDLSSNFLGRDGYAWKVFKLVIWHPTGGFCYQTFGFVTTLCVVCLGTYGFFHNLEKRLVSRRIMLYLQRG